MSPPLGREHPPRQSTPTRPQPLGATSSAARVSSRHLTFLIGPSLLSLQEQKRPRSAAVGGSVPRIVSEDEERRRAKEEVRGGTGQQAVRVMVKAPVSLLSVMMLPSLSPPHQPHSPQRREPPFHSLLQGHPGPSTSLFRLGSLRSQSRNWSRDFSLPPGCKCGGGGYTWAPHPSLQTDHTSSGHLFTKSSVWVPPIETWQGQHLAPRRCSPGDW